MALAASLLWLGMQVGLAQAVSITLRLDATSIPIGGTTTLRAFAQIVPGQRATAEQIFSWYVDLLNQNPQIARASYTDLQKPASDNDPRTSSKGTDDAAHRRGIYDTFLSLAKAGRDTPVELFNVPITGMSSGRATFGVQAGTTLPHLSADFIVAPAGGGTPLTGGDYSNAQLQLEVTTGTAGPRLQIADTPLPGQKHRLTLTFAAAPGRSYVVEFRDHFGAGSRWQPLPGAPHNPGSVTVTNDTAQRFYRLRID